MSIVAMIANVMSAGRIHFDCVTTMNLLRTLLFIFITVSFVCFVASANDVFANSFLATVAVFVVAR